MRSLSLRYLVICTIGIVALLSISLGVQSLAGLTKHTPKAHAASAPSPIGKWHLVVTFTSTGEQQESDIEFNSYTGNSASLYTGPLTNYTPFYGTGQWYVTGSNQFSYQFTETIYGYNGTLVGHVQVTQNGTLSSDGNTYDAQGQGMFFPAYGAPVNPPGPTVTHAVRE